MKMIPKILQNDSKNSIFRIVLNMNATKREHVDENLNVSEEISAESALFRHFQVMYSGESQLKHPW